MSFEKCVPIRVPTFPGDIFQGFILGKGKACLHSLTSKFPIYTFDFPTCQACQRANINKSNDLTCFQLQFPGTYQRATRANIHDFSMLVRASPVRGTRATLFLPAKGSPDLRRISVFWGSRCRALLHRALTGLSALYGANLGRIGRIWEPLGNRALFSPNLALVKIWGRTRSPDKRPLNF